MKQTNDFDERQISLQGKYGYKAFSLCIFMNLLNAYIKQYFNFNYATPVNECLMVVLIPIAYFTISTVLTNSYFSFSRKRKLNIVILADLVITLIFFVAYLFLRNCFTDILQNGLYSGWSGVLMVSIFTFIVILAHVVRFIKDKKEENL